MKEDFMYFIWQSGGLFSLELETVDRKPISIIRPGYRNRGEGPDFFDARIRIGGITWYGPIEFHLKTSDWDLHGHQNDPAYDNVILHIVMEHDREIKTSRGVNLPTLCLKNHVNPIQLKKYRLLEKSKSWIPCEGLFSQSNRDIFWPQFLARLALERLEDKSKRILSEVEETGGNWDSVVFAQMGKYLVGNINADAMMEMLRSFPFQLISKYRYEELKIHALLYGQAGMLDSPIEDQYHNMLCREYNNLRLKHRLKPISKNHWKLMPIRPPSFPTLRISQLAQLMISDHRPLRRFIRSVDSREIKHYLRVSAAKYWDKHFSFGNPAAKKYPKKTGSETVELLILNVAAPVLFAYGQYSGNEDLKERALSWLENLKPEANRIIKNWNRMGIVAKTGLESQGLLQLKSQYCSKGRCLECTLGNKLLQESLAAYSN